MSKNYEKNERKKVRHADNYGLDFLDREIRDGMEAKLAEMQGRPVGAMSPWTHAPDMDYETPAVLLGAKGSVCLNCGKNLRHKTIHFGFFCSIDCAYERIVETERTQRGEQ